MKICVVHGKTNVAAEHFAMQVPNAVLQPIITAGVAADAITVPNVYPD
jgi:hypothetical protein